MGIRSISEIRIRFKTTEPDGTILYSPPRDIHNADSLFIQLVAGSIKIVFDCGSGEGELTLDPGAGVAIHNDMYHELEITLRKCEALASLDGTVSNVSTASGKSTQLNLADIYLGGVADTETYRVSLNGCISNVEFNDVTLDLTNPIEGFDIDNCDMNICMGVTCVNGGRCIDSPSNVKGKRNSVIYK